jgi:pimeloyl-ACP methyl ester carboxylesterase
MPCKEWHVIAPDWRGFGLTERAPAQSYWFPDYLADLDAILDHYAGEEPINLLGHSMGGNVVSLYAGVRPQRIKRLVNLEGIGLPTAKPEQAPGRFTQWLDEMKNRPCCAATTRRSRGTAAEEQRAPVRRARRFPGPALGAAG